MHEHTDTVAETIAELDRLLAGLMACVDQARALAMRLDRDLERQRKNTSIARDTGARKLVFLASPPDDRCPVCGFDLDVPGEAAAHLGALAHVACADAESASAMRGGA